MTVQTIAKKFRRALRNGTGATFTPEQLKELAEIGLLKTLAILEAEELCPAKIHPTSSETTGSTNGATANPRSGKSPRTNLPHLDRSSIAALTSAA